MFEILKSSKICFFINRNGQPLRLRRNLQLRSMLKSFFKCASLYKPFGEPHPQKTKARNYLNGKNCKNEKSTNRAMVKFSAKIKYSSFLRVSVFKAIFAKKQRRIRLLDHRHISLKVTLMH